MQQSILPLDECLLLSQEHMPLGKWWHDRAKADLEHYHHPRINHEPVYVRSRDDGWLAPRDGVGDYFWFRPINGPQRQIHMRGTAKSLALLLIYRPVFTWSPGLQLGFYVHQLRRLGLPIKTVFRGADQRNYYQLHGSLVEAPELEPRRNFDPVTQPWLRLARN